jgi:hypothetical protein
MKTTRRELDDLYIENPYPREAVKRAWNVAGEMDDDDIIYLVNKQKDDSEGLAAMLEF